MTIFKTSDQGWNPYLAGALVGLLAIASAFATTKILGKTNFLGASTTFVRAAGYIEQMISPQYVEANEYFVKEKIKFDWQFALVTGILLGAFFSSVSDHSFKIEAIPPIWKERFGSSVILRALEAFIGGAIAIFGARLGDGCPSGHGLSGLMQLSLSGFVAVSFFFGFGILTAHFVYGGKKS